MDKTGKQQKNNLLSGLRLYQQRQSNNSFNYVIEQILYLFFGWVPTILGIGLRGLFYRLILKHGRLGCN